MIVSFNRFVIRVFLVNMVESSYFGKCGWDKFEEGVVILYYIKVLIGILDFLVIMGVRVLWG